MDDLDTLISSLYDDDRLRSKRLLQEDPDLMNRVDDNGLTPYDHFLYAESTRGQNEPIDEELLYMLMPDNIDISHSPLGGVNMPTLLIRKTIPGQIDILKRYMLSRYYVDLI